MPNADQEIAKTSEYQSPLEQDVAEYLGKNGITITPQYRVGHYMIDLAVRYVGGASIAIECDGDRYHTDETHQADMMRQKVLERAGWIFFRIRGTEFYSDRVSTMQKTLQYLLAQNAKENKEIAKDLKESAIPIHDQQYLPIDPEIKAIVDIPNATRTLSVDNQMAINQSQPVFIRNHEPEPIDTLKLDQKMKDVDNISPIISEAVPDFIYSDAKMWFALAHWAKENKQLTPFLRGASADLGKKTKIGNLSLKQKNFMKSIYSKARAGGFQWEPNPKKERFNTAELLKTSESKIVEIGDRVHYVEMPEEKAEHWVTITRNSNISSDFIVSHDKPIAKILLSSSVGDIVRLELSEGPKEFKIIRIAKASIGSSIE